jgi:hypothetical protein
MDDNILDSHTVFMAPLVEGYDTSQPLGEVSRHANQLLDLMYTRLFRPRRPSLAAAIESLPWSKDAHVAAMQVLTRDVLLHYFSQDWEYLRLHVSPALLDAMRDCHEQLGEEKGGPFKVRHVQRD